MLQADGGANTGSKNYMEVQIEQKIATTKKEAKEGKCELPNSSSFIMGSL